MNALMNVSQVLTMSSQEIADLVESRHDSVKRAIERLAEKGVIQLSPMVEVRNHLGQAVSVYQLEKRDSYVVVAQLSPEFTARLVDRWQELESKAAGPDLATDEGKLLLIQDMALKQLALIQSNKRLEVQRDEAVRTKAWIGSKREATAMSTAAAAKREAEALKHALGFSARHATILQVEDAAGGDYDFVLLRRWCKANEVTPEVVPDKRYPKGVKAWPAGAWLAVYGIDLRELFPLAQAA